MAKSSWKSNERINERYYSISNSFSILKSGFRIKRFYKAHRIISFINRNLSNMDSKNDRRTYKSCKKWEISNGIKEKRNSKNDGSFNWNVSWKHSKQIRKIKDGNISNNNGSLKRYDRYKI